MIDLRQELVLQRRHFAQCGDFVEIGKASDVILRRQELCPWGERRQLIEGISTLPGEGLSPPLQWALAGGVESFHVGGNRRGGPCQLIQAQPRSRERVGLRSGRGLDILLKLGEPSRGVYVRSGGRCVHENRERIAYAFEKARPQDLLIGQPEETRAQGQQVAGEVPAVHRRNVEGRQRFQGSRVVPVVEVALVPFQAFHGVECLGRTLDEFSGGNDSRSRTRTNSPAAQGPCWWAKCDARSRKPGAPDSCPAAASDLPARRRSRRTPRFCGKASAKRGSDSLSAVLRAGRAAD